MIARSEITVRLARDDHLVVPRTGPALDDPPVRARLLNEVMEIRVADPMRKVRLPDGVDADAQVLHGVDRPILRSSRPNARSASRVAGEQSSAARMRGRGKTPGSTA